MMKHKASALILLAGLALCSVPSNAQDGQNGQRGQDGQPGGQGQGRGQGGRGGAQMTPQQMQQMRDEALKTQMTAQGISDAAQVAIIAYAGARETAAIPLRAQARTLQEALGNNISAEVATRQLAALREAIRAEKERRATAEAELDTAIEFSKNPNLEAYLTVAGFIGDESAIIGAPGGGRGGQRGRGGPGQGGRRGGQGGRGGQGQGGQGQGGQGQGGPGQGDDNAPE